MSRRQYPFHLIEPKWQRHWEQEQTFRAFNPGEAIPAAHPFAQRHRLKGAVSIDHLPAKYYILDMFPYPSGAGLHVGHPEGYTATDILARYRRAKGFHVLHPMGWDSFGLPAEQYAVKTGQHPRQTTEQNIANFTRQIKALGFSYDWSRELATTNPDYFRWTQWIFLQIYNSYFDPVRQSAAPIALLEDALSDQPTRLPEWDEDPYLTKTRELWLKQSAGKSATELAAARRQLLDQSRLAYVSEAPVNWCPELGTVLSNEEVIDGRSEIGGFPVFRKPMRQWMLRITAYAERLLTDLEPIDWSDSLKEMQRNWIGRSEGAELEFKIDGCESSIRVFTTRPDTLFGATYMVLSPEHKLVAQVTTSQQAAAIRDYQHFAATKSDLERTELTKEKTGVWTGAYAINPVNAAKIPIWIADYVLATYGTGAIMAVPGHDERDFEFAQKFKLPIIQVVQPPDPKADWRGFTDEGSAINSANPEITLDGLTTSEAKRRITEWLEKKGIGQKTVNYKLRDWLFSRQRYWGEPFPIVWKPGADGTLRHEALPETSLPVLPPALDDYKPTPEGQPPLARAKEWVNLPDGSVRETNTMPQWAGSCWYYLRYLDAKNAHSFVQPAVEQYWMGATKENAANPASGPLKSVTPGVDLYVGGTEHAVLHLLYARFWHKILFDLGHVSTPEPFFKLVNQGLILGEMEFTAFSHPDGRPCSVADLRDIDEEATGEGARMFGIHKVSGEKILGNRVPEEQVEKTGDGFALKGRPAIRVDARSFKMSKSRGNVVNPDAILHDFGADALRLYEMFLGPLQDTKPWSTKGVEGVYRFLGRVWRLFVDEKSETAFEQAETTAASPMAELLDHILIDGTIADVSAQPGQLKTLHACIKKVTEDLDGMRFNTAISAMMVFVNEANGWQNRPFAVMKVFLQLLAPFAPHLAEELWARLHQAFGQIPPSLTYTTWPQFDPAHLIEDTLEIPVQVNGKLRDVIKVGATASQQEIEQTALQAEKVKPFLEGKTVKKIIIVPRRLVNIVVG
jgi:leucyl-tRNA synthetase